MSTIREFISELSNFGTASKNRFEAVLNPPNSFGNIFNNVTPNPTYFGVSYKKSLTLRGNRCQIPERSLILSQRVATGVPVFLPNGSETTPLQLGITSSSDFGEYNLLSTWNSLIINNNTATINFPQEYYGTLDLYLPNIEQSQLHIRFLKLFPKNVPQIDLDFSSKNEVIDFTVTFQYKKFINLTLGEN